MAALGLRKMQQTVIHNDTPSIRGMIHHVKHMLEVTEGPAPEAKSAPAPKVTKSTAPTAAKPKATAEKAPAKPKAEKKSAKKESE